MEILGSDPNRELGSQFNDLVIFTTTLYRSDEVSQARAALALELLKRVQSLGIKCVVADAGSDENFLEQLQQLNGIKVISVKGKKMGEQRRAALREAKNLVPPNIKYPEFLWTEPEKTDLITSENLSAMITKLRTGEADVVVPARDNMDGYPTFQQWIEKRANRRVEKNIIPVEHIDLWFGPKMFNQAGAEYFINYKPDPKKSRPDLWDSVFCPVLDAARDGKTIVSVPVKFDYPDNQRDAEIAQGKTMKRKRVDQYVKILAALDDPYWSKKVENSRD